MKQIFDTFLHVQLPPYVKVVRWFSQHDEIFRHTWLKN